MKESRKKKLSLNKETIARLAETQLKVIHGGATTTHCGPQYNSICVCEETGRGCPI